MIIEMNDKKDMMRKDKKKSQEVPSATTR